jgi:hypothetical protein
MEPGGKPCCQAKATSPISVVRYSTPVLFRHCDETKTLTYSITIICLSIADGEQSI